MATPEPRSLPVREMTWLSLLGKWVDFAKASRALPGFGEAGRWKEAVPAIIELQATIWALRDLAAIPPADRAFARDRAEVLLRRSSGVIDEVWAGEPLPAEIIEMEADAIVALREALYAGLVELVWPGPGPYEVPAVDLGPVEGTLAVMPPGSLAMPDEPIAWFTERDPISIPGCVARPAARPRQVYRELDIEGRFVADLVAPLEGDLPPGLPMLVPISLAGAPIGRFMHEREEWLALQRGAFAGRETIPVLFVE